MNLKEWATGVVIAIKGHGDDMSGLQARIDKQDARIVELTRYCAEAGAAVKALQDNPPMAIVPAAVLTRLEAVEKAQAELGAVSALLDDLPELPKLL